MKRLALMLAVVASLGLAPGAVWAQKGAETPKPKSRPKKDRPKRVRSLLRGEYFIMTKVCQLSLEQQKKIAELAAQRNKEQKQIQEKLKAARAARAEARKSKDKDAIKKADAGYRKVAAERSEISKKWRKQILGELEPEQRATWQEFTVVREIKRRLPGVKLTQDQQDKLKAAYVERTTGVDLADEKARRAAVMKLTAHVMVKIITEQQRQTIRLEHIKRRFRRAKLTEEQLGQVKAALAEQTASADPADAKALNAAMKKLNDHVQEQILTDQQRQAMKPKPRKKPAPAKAAEQPKAKPARD